MFDLLVIGAGPGGYTAAARAAKLGLSTAIVEERSWGGTCLNRGCVPTKTLLHASEVYRSAADGAAIGIHAEGLRADIRRSSPIKSASPDSCAAGWRAF